MPQAPRYSKNERTLNRELARLARRLHKTEAKKDDLIERCFDQLNLERKEQTRRAHEAAEQAARRALELVLQHQIAQKAARERADARHTTLCRSAALCLLGIMQAACVVYTYMP